MKRSILMLLAIAVALIFFGCEKESFAPELEQENLEESALKGAKDKRSFEGICTPVIPPAIEGDNEWYDQTDDWRTTGNTIWVITGPGFSGTAELTVEAKNPHEENRGKWEMTWEGTVIPKLDEAGIEIGVDIVAKAWGQGVNGKVKGMKTNWIYTMDFTYANPETFFYVVEGNIEKPQGPIKHMD